MMVVGWDPSALVPSIDAAVAAGIPVVCVDADVPASRRLSFIGTDWFEIGVRQAEAMVKALAGRKGRVALLGLIEQDEGNLQAALEYLELSRDHLTTVTNPASWYDTLMPLIAVCRALGDYEKEAVYQAELDDLRRRFPALNG